MNIVGRVSLTAAVGMLGVAVALGRVGERPPENRALQRMSAATSYFDSTIVLARGSVPRGTRGDELAVSLGYLERLRLGAGSPFRLVNEALVDPRLGSANIRVAWALLGRLRRGDAYAIDPQVLDGAGPWDANGHGATGAAHVALIEHAIASASDPRAGETAVRLAYTIESAKGTIAPGSARVAEEVAALVRDRLLAMRDLSNLLSDATEQRLDPLTLLNQRRALHEFEVERPALVPLGTTLETEASSTVPNLLRELDTLDRVASPRIDDGAFLPVIGTHFAERLAQLGAALPPVPQVLVTLRGRSPALAAVTNEETLVAANAAAVFNAAPDSTTRSTAVSVLGAAVAVRSLAQDDPWFPGDTGPDAADLVSEFGLAGVTFGKAVPGEWHSYYLRELQTSLRDVETVFPGFSFSGLRVRFGTEALRDSALAMHDPRNRTLSLPIATAGGTLAHELSHDLDWQTAQRVYADGTGYSTDRAVRDRRGSLASSIRGLAGARLTRAYSGVAPADRPTEIFARGTDWFIASSLAQQGRTNGFLSAIQDGVFSGYAAGAPAALGVAGTSSLLSAIDAMTFLPDSASAPFESQWSDPSVVDPVLMVRRALDANVSFRGIPFRPRAADPLSGAGSLAVCIADSSSLGRARESLLMLAVDARARGMAVRRARFRPSSMQPGTAQSLLGVPPYSPEPGERMIAELRATVVSSLGGSIADQGVLPVVPAIFRSSSASCATSAR